ncbi:MAG: DNA polymerase III subunit gamma/tau [Fidelibacterota bacterium]
MSHQVISLKYRPQRFEDVVGQEHITITLKNAVQKNRLGHAYIFSGPRGTGKTTTARLLAKLVNCEDPRDGNPCNECVSCREITEGRSLDVLEIDGGSTRGIDSIRDLREQVKYPAARGKYRIYIIDEFHQITKEGFNALLKTLEEPPKHILFIFATTELHKVLPTILSRCQRFEFRRIPLMQVMDLLRTIADKEKISISDDSLLLIAKKGDGSIRDSESILEQVIAFSAGEINYDNILNILGVIHEEVYFDIFRSLVSGQAVLALRKLDDMLMRGYDLKELLSGFSVFLRDLYMVRSYGSADILDTTENLKKSYAELAEDRDPRILIRMLSLINNEMPNLGYTANVKILVETLFIKLSNLQDFADLDKVLKKIKKTQKEAQSAGNTHGGNTPISGTPVRPAGRPAPPAQKHYESPILNNANSAKKKSDTAGRPEEKKTPASASGEKEKSGKKHELKDIREKWEEFIECIQPEKPAIAGLLCRVGLLRVKNGSLVIAAEDDYSCNALQRNRQIINVCLKRTYGEGLSLRVEKSNVSEKERAVKKGDIDPATQNVIQSFDGELL